MHTMWPDYFPEQCPPADARRDTLEVYRLVAGMPPSANDFLPTLLESPHRQFKPESLCLACGVSVFKTAADALRARAKFKPLRTKLLARGTITPEDGLVLETGQPTHTTWWLQSAAPHSKFAGILLDVTN